MKKKIEPWRIIVFVISLIFIALMWVKNDIVSIYATMPQEQVLPFIFTTVLVSSLKVTAIAIIILVIKWILKKVNHG